jgi:aminodeoxyfutalosine synthase
MLRSQDNSLVNNFSNGCCSVSSREELSRIAEKIYSGERLSREDGVRLFQSSDLLGLGTLANYVREKMHGNKTYYNQNLHLNPTNVCEADCIFCSFARLKVGMPEAYTMSVAQAISWIGERYVPGMTEVHIVSGLNPDLDFSYYTDLLRAIKSNYPALHIKAFTAVEIHYFANKFSLSYGEVLDSLVEAGLGSLPGGGAEIFAPRARKKLCNDKVNALGWLDVHRTAHLRGLKSNCTMLYGTIETIEERVDHLLSLRALQDETGGFQAFIPLAYHPEGNRLGAIGAPTGADDLRTIAVSRLLLDNIAHIKAYWVMLGVKTAQLSQVFGSNDLDGTVTEEKIYKMAGAKSGGRSQGVLGVDELRELIADIGRVPVERTTTYELINDQ